MWPGARPAGRDRRLNLGEAAQSIADHHRQVAAFGQLGVQRCVAGVKPEHRRARRIGGENLIVVATPAKLARTPVLRFDTGDAALDAELTESGYLPVVIGYRLRRLAKVQPSVMAVAQGPRPQRDESKRGDKDL